MTSAYNLPAKGTATIKDINSSELQGITFLFSHHSHSGSDWRASWQTKKLLRKVSESHDSEWIQIDCEWVFSCQGNVPASSRPQFFLDLSLHQHRSLWISTRKSLTRGLHGCQGHSNRKAWQGNFLLSSCPITITLTFTLNRLTEWFSVFSWTLTTKFTGKIFKFSFPSRTSEVKDRWKVGFYFHLCLNVDLYLFCNKRLWVIPGTYWKHYTPFACQAQWQSKSWS